MVIKTKNLTLAQVVLKCYAKENKNKQWYAVCLDLNLVVQGDNKNQVIEKLHEVVQSYVAEALGEDSKYFDDLIPRKAPVYFYLWYYLIKVEMFFMKAVKSDSFKFTLFNEHLPLSAHG
jgi:hypothetical protein